MTENKFVSPVYGVRPVPVEKLRANAYNPNVVATKEMELLALSIKEDGFTMPIVCYYIKNEDIYEIVDGFHRYTVLKTNKEIYERENGMAPVSVIDKPLEERIASTIRHNRARGVHTIDGMSKIMVELVRDLHMSDKWVGKNLGMSMDEILKLKQETGLAELFSNEEFFPFSPAWEPKQ